MLWPENKFIKVFNNVYLVYKIIFGTLSIEKKFYDNNTILKKIPIFKQKFKWTKNPSIFKP